MIDRRSFLKTAGLVAGATSMGSRTLFGDLPGDRIPRQPKNVKELMERRSAHGKLYKLPAKNDYRFTGSVGMIHWQNEPGKPWQDIDCTWSERGGLWRVDDVGYHVTFDPKRMVMTYRSRRGGELRLRLAEIDGKEPRVSQVEQFAGGDRLRLRGVADGVDLVVVARGDAPEIYRKIQGDKRPLIAWDVEDDSRGRIGTNLGRLVGWDNHDLLDTSRVGTRQRLPVEIQYVTSRVTPDSYRMTECLTGRVKQRDPVTRIARWEQGLAGPAFLDVTINENTTQSNDDGNGYNAGASETWEDNSNYVYFTANQDPAWRFQTVDIPQGATINSATLTVYVHNSDTTMLAALHGQLATSAEVWTNTSNNGPERMTRTTASTVFGTFATAGSTSRSVATSLQEIVNQGAWATGNNCRFGCRDATAGTSVQFRAVTYFGTGDAGKLAADYTSGGAPARRPLMLTGVGDK